MADPGRRRPAAIIGLVSVALLLHSVAALGTPGDPEPLGPGPLADAWLAPADVTCCLHVEGAAHLRADLARRPIARLIQGRLDRGDLGAAWSSLARRAELDAGELFDLLLGRQFTLFVRAASDDAPADWALVTRPDPFRAVQMIERLAPRRLGPRCGLATADLPEQELRLCRDGSRLLFGPARGRLFEEIAPRMAAGPPGRDDDHGLAAHPAIRRSRTLGRGAAALFLRYGAPLNGWTVLVADVDAADLAIRVRGSFENPPFRRPLTERPWDMSALDAIEDASLLAVIEPTDIGDGEVELFAQAMLGEPLIDRAMRLSVGECRILALGEVEGRQEPNRADMLVPTGAVAIRIKEHGVDPRALDDAAARVARAVARLQPGGRPVEVPAVWTDAANRHIDLRPVMERFGAGHPILDAVSLNWCIAKGASGSYYVIATHPDQLERCTRAIEETPCGKIREGRWASCGTLNGRRLGHHLESYSGEIARLATGTPEDAAIFRETIVGLAQLFDGMDRCRWQLRRPTVNDVTLDIQVKLSAPESAEGE